MIDVSYNHSPKFSLNLSFEIETYKFIGVHGKTGSGKTTLLKLLAGLLVPNQGKIVFNGALWFDKKTKVDIPVQKRNVGIVFQGYSLFPNLSVIENLRYGHNGQIDLEGIITDFKLEDLVELRPKSLSGGQAQRVAIARAIASNPDLLLLDEPFSAQDEESRSELYTLVHNYQKKCNYTAVLISHYSRDILAICDHLICLNKGRLSYQGSPIEYFEHTIVNANKIEGTIVHISHNYITLKTGEGYIKIQLESDKKEYSIGQFLSIEGKFEIG